MTKKDRIYEVLETLSGPYSEDNKKLFNFIMAIPTGDSSILWNDVMDFLNIYVKMTIDELKTGDYVDISQLTVKNFRKKYYDNETYLVVVKNIDELNKIKSPKYFPNHYSTGDKEYVYENGEFVDITDKHDLYLKQYLNFFLLNKCFTYSKKDGIKKGFNRRNRIIKIDDDSITFINNEDWSWYLVNELLNFRNFVDFLERKNKINSLFLTLFSSVEKDKQTSVVENNNNYDEIKSKIDKLRVKFSSGYKTKAMSDSIYKYLSSWFDIGYNSSIVLLPIRDRLKTVSRYIERYYPTELPPADAYNYFNGKNFNIANQSYGIKDDKLSLNITYENSEVTSRYVSNWNYQYWAIASTSENYNAFGATSGDVAAYYGYYKPSNPFKEKEDGVNPGVYGREFFITDSAESIKTFCFYAMSSESGKQYDKFLEFLSSSYYNSSPLSTMEGHPVSGYINDVYDILFSQ